MGESTEPATALHGRCWDRCRHRVLWSRLETFWRRQHQSGVFKVEQEPPCGAAGCVCVNGGGDPGICGVKARLVVVGNKAGGGMRLGLYLTRGAT